MKNTLLSIITLLTIMTFTATSKADETTNLLLGEDSGSLAKVRIVQIVERDAEVRIQVQNFSDDLLYVYDRGKAPQCHVELHNRKGEQCRLTMEGDSYFSDFNRTFSGVFRELEIGQQREWIVNLKEMFKIEPGEYKLSFKMSLQGKIVKSPIEKDPKSTEIDQTVRIQVNKFLVK